MFRTKLGSNSDYGPHVQALLMHVITHQPDDPIGYFQEEITKIKKEMDELNVGCV